MKEELARQQSESDKKDQAPPPGYMDPASDQFNLFSSPMYLMAHVDFQFHEDLDKVIGKLGLSRTQYRLLTVLANHNPLNIGDLSGYALLKRSTCSHALVAMRKNGWIETSTNTADSRIIEVELTKDGRTLIKRAMRSSTLQTQRTVQGLSKKDLDHLTKTLQRMVSNLSTHPIE